MAVFIRGGKVQSGGWSNNSGIFMGQTIQNGWDSFTPEKYTAGFLMGDACFAPTAFNGYFSWALISHPTRDEDWKENLNYSVQQ